MFYRRFHVPTVRFRSPFEELEQMRNNMDRLMGAFSGSPAIGRRAGVFPLINLTEDKDNFYVRAELPGVETGDLDIQATGNSLSIAGERKITPQKDGVKYHRREREAGKFSRIISLPDHVDTAKVDARLTDGVLTVVVPKAEAAKPRQIAVK